MSYTGTYRMPFFLSLRVLVKVALWQPLALFRVLLAAGVEALGGSSRVLSEFVVVDHENQLRVEGDLYFTMTCHHALSSAARVAKLPVAKKTWSPMSSRIRRASSRSRRSCAAEMQNRTRLFSSGVAGEPTTTIASLRARQARENAGILAGCFWWGSS